MEDLQKITIQKKVGNDVVTYERQTDDVAWATFFIDIAKDIEYQHAAVYEPQNLDAEMRVKPKLEYDVEPLSMCQLVSRALYEGKTDLNDIKEHFIVTDAVIDYWQRHNLIEEQP